MLDVAITKRLGAFTVDVAFTAPVPGVTALFGASGAGKTSIVRALAGLGRPDSGRIALGGLVFFDSAKGIDVPVERRRVGYVFQDSRLFPHLTVADNLRYGLRRAPADDRLIPFDHVVALLGIGGLLERRPHTLSGGERQRVAIGRALLSQPRLLLMDEPLASLDEDRKREVLPYIERLRDDLSLPVVYVSHSRDEVERLARTLIVVEQGRVVAAGEMAELSARLDVRGMSDRRDAATVIDTTVLGHDEPRRLTRLGFEGGELVVGAFAAAPGARLRVLIPAREVIVATKRPEGISVRNVLAGRVGEINDRRGGDALVQVRVGATAILARVTRDAVERLDLAPGREVYALIKASSVERPGA
ncbi:MAG: molybdenum ABC transporter ATP-binding protein [Gemmatimonas sp.]